MSDEQGPIDVEGLRAEFLHQVFDEYELNLDAQALATYAQTCGETALRFVDVDHEDFQAPPTISSSLQPRKRYPDGFPTFAGLGMDAGKAVYPHHPIRPGQPITVRTHMQDIYTKTGRSGRMVFFVNRLSLTDANGVLLAEADTSIVIRETPSSASKAD